MPRPKSCSKCGGTLKEKELTLWGRRITGSFTFDTYICEKCGFTEFYYKE